MKTVSVKISEELDARIRRALKRRKETFSDWARRALERETEEQECDFAGLAASCRGMFEGPEDLSTREGYGDRHDR